MRGPLIPPHSPSGSRPHRLGRVEFFNDCVTAAIEEITSHCPNAFDGVIVGVEDVPTMNATLSGDRVPLSAAIEPTSESKAQIVVFERPLEHRASSRSDLRLIVHRTIVEQLSTLTARPVSDLAGEGFDLD